MSFQSTCFDGFLSERVCQSDVSPPLFNSSFFNASLPLIPPKSLTTAEPGTTAEPEFTTSLFESTVGITNAPGYTTPTISITEEPLSPGIIALIVICCIVFLVCLCLFLLYKTKWCVSISKHISMCRGKQPEADKKGVESSQVCDGNVMKVVAVGNIQLIPQTRSTEKLSLGTRTPCELANTYDETPGTPILNVPRGIGKANYEDVGTSSEEDLTNPGKQNINKNTSIIRENSQAPLVENAESFDNEIRHNSTNLDTKM